MEKKMNNDIDAEDLINAGAECIHGTTPNIFRHVLGKTERAYLR